MQLLRLVIFFVLTLALPTMGVAALSTSGQCQMARTGALPMAMSQMDCGGSADQGDMQHSPCKMSIDCKTFSPYQPSVHPSPAKPLPAAQSIQAQLDHPEFSHTPDGLWRPPCSL